MCVVSFALISPIIMATESQFSTALLWDGGGDGADEDVSEQRPSRRQFAGCLHDSLISLGNEFSDGIGGCIFSTHNCSTKLFT